jgi:hypothetical protein
VYLYLQVTMYEDSSLPEFVVNKATFDKGCQLMKGTRVKMYFSNVDSGTQRKAAAKPAGTWYTGVVVNNLFPVDGQVRILPADLRLITRLAPALPPSPSLPLSCHVALIQPLHPKP